MNTIWLIIFGIIVFIIILVFIYMHLYNKINDSIIRSYEAEGLIDTSLRDKYDLVDRGLAILKSKITIDEDIFKDFIKLKLRKISNFDLDRILIKTYNEFLPMCDLKEFKKNTELDKIKEQVEDIDEELTTLRYYYNKNITIYNNIIKKFPAIIVAKINHYNEKSFYDLKDMTDSNYDDFKL